MILYLWLYFYICNRANVPWIQAVSRKGEGLCRWGGNVPATIILNFQLWIQTSPLYVLIHLNKRKSICPKSCRSHHSRLSILERDFFWQFICWSQCCYHIGYCCWFDLLFLDNSIIFVVIVDDEIGLFLVGIVEIFCKALFTDRSGPAIIGYSYIGINKTSIVISSSCCCWWWWWWCCCCWLFCCWWWGCCWLLLLLFCTVLFAWRRGPAIVGDSWYQLKVLMYFVVVVMLLLLVVVLIVVVLLLWLLLLFCKPLFAWSSSPAIVGDSWYSERTLERLNYFKLLHCSPFQLHN